MNKKLLGNQCNHILKEDREFWNIPKNYTKWLGQYIPDTSLPKFNNKKDLYEFLLNSMYVGCPYFCATNKEVLDEIAKEMYMLNVSYIIEPYNNLECKYTMWIDKSVFDILKEKINGN